MPDTRLAQSISELPCACREGRTEALVACAVFARTAVGVKLRKYLAGYNMTGVSDTRLESQVCCKNNAKYVCPEYLHATLWPRI